MISGAIRSLQGGQAFVMTTTMFVMITFAGLHHLVLSSLFSIKVQIVTRNHNENIHSSCVTIVIVNLSYNETNHINQKCLKLAFNHINQKSFKLVFRVVNFLQVYYTVSVGMDLYHLAPNFAILTLRWWTYF